MGRLGLATNCDSRTNPEFGKASNVDWLTTGLAAGTIGVILGDTFCAFMLKTVSFPGNHPPPQVLTQHQLGVCPVRYGVSVMEQSLRKRSHALPNEISVNNDRSLNAKVLI